MNTFTKLKDGTWGVRVEGATKAGATVVVQKKDGSTATEKIKAVLWSGQGVSLCSLQPKDGVKAPFKQRTHPYVCGECGEKVTPGTSCWETGMRH